MACSKQTSICMSSEILVFLLWLLYNFTPLVDNLTLIALVTVRLFEWRIRPQLRCHACGFCWPCPRLEWETIILFPSLWFQFDDFSTAFHVKDVLLAKYCFKDIIWRRSIVILNSLNGVITMSHPKGFFCLFQLHEFKVDCSSF